jgi:hypothetical protein
VQWEKGTKEGERKGAVSEKKEENEEHDHKLGNGPERVSEDAGKIAPYICADALDGMARVDGVGDCFDSGGDGGMTAKELAELLLGRVIAQGMDGVNGLPADVLREEEAGDNDGQYGKNKGKRGGSGAMPDS